MMLLDTENKANTEPRRRPDKLDGISAEDRLTIEAFLRGLQKLISMESLEAIKRDCVPTICPCCKQLVDSNFEFWRPGKLKRREVEVGALKLQCPLCRLIVDCLPPITDFQIPNTKRFSGLSPRPQNMTHAVLKVGRLDGM